MKLDGFATLYMDKLESLKGLYKSLDQEDAMVHALNHCTFNLNPRAPSIDTCLHGYVPYAHVDHVHSDAVIAIAAAEDSEALTKQVFGDEMGYLPWQRPGIDLGIKLGNMAAAKPKLVGVVLGSHGLFTWGKTAKESYDTTLRIINKAAIWLEQNRKKPAFNGEKVEVSSQKTNAKPQPCASCLPSVVASRRSSIKSATSLMRRKCLEFVNSNQLDASGPTGHVLPGPFPAHQDPPIDRAA